MATTVAARRKKGSRALVAGFERLFAHVYVFATKRVAQTVRRVIGPSGGAIGREGHGVGMIACPS